MNELAGFRRKSDFGCCNPLDAKGLQRNRVILLQIQDLRDGADECLDEGGCDLGDDCIACAPQECHASGNPMSQREKAGLSWDASPLAVGARHDTGRYGLSLANRPLPPFATGVGQPASASIATSFSGRALIPC